MATIIAISGGTGSGKSTLATHLVAQLGEARASVLPEDSYYLCRTSFADFDETTHDFDVPAAKDFRLLAEHLGMARRGRGFETPVYDFSQHARTGATQKIEVRDFLVLEGILALTDPDVCAQIDLGVWLETPDDVRILRRLERDIAERGRTPQSVISQYFNTARPAFQQFAPPQRAAAHMILDAEGMNYDLEKMAGAILARLPAAHT
jgi:uridine kinase